MSLFITFEGSEGCGKSTQAKALWRKLVRLNIPAVLTHEPGGTALGNQLRHTLKRGRQDKISPLAELFLFAGTNHLGYQLYAAGGAKKKKKTTGGTSKETNTSRRCL